jgi:hypothetical protein
MGNRGIMVSVRISGRKYVNYYSISNNKIINKTKKIKITKMIEIVNIVNMINRINRIYKLKKYPQKYPPTNKNISPHKTTKYNQNSLPNKHPSLLLHSNNPTNPYKLPQKYPPIMNLI